MRDEIGILLNSYGMEYTHEDQPWRIPEGEFTAAGDYYPFDLQQFEPFVFEEHVMRAINGYRSQSGAASSLVPSEAGGATLAGSAEPPTSNQGGNTARLGRGDDTT